MLAKIINRKVKILDKQKFDTFLCSLYNVNRSIVYDYFINPHTPYTNELKCCMSPP